MRKKFFLATILTIIICMGAALSIGGIAYAEALDNDECDVVFWENISELYEGNERTLSVAATKEPIFDINLNLLGFIYDFNCNGEQGYAIIISIDGQFVATEFFFGTENPYKIIPEAAQRIYVSTLIYIYFYDNDYYFADNGILIDDETLTALSIVAYSSDDTIYGSFSEYVYFSDRTEVKHELAKRHPGLYEVGGLSNACAAIAGGNLIQYWDRYKTNLIGDYSPGTTVGSLYLYKESSSATDNMITQLYSDMGSSQSGTTVAQFKNGISTFCTRKGYTATFSSCMSGSTFNYTAAKQKLNAGEPLALFLYTYTVSDFYTEENSDYLTYKIGSGAHVMAGFGYKEVTYALTSGGTRQDKYIAVASGFFLRKRGYFNINYNTQIDDAYALSIS